MTAKIAMLADIAVPSRTCVPAVMLPLTLVLFVATLDQTIVVTAFDRVRAAADPASALAAFHAVFLSAPLLTVVALLLTILMEVRFVRDDDGNRRGED